MSDRKVNGYIITNQSDSPTPFTDVKKDGVFITHRPPVPLEGIDRPTNNPGLTVGDGEHIYSFQNKEGWFGKSISVTEHSTSGKLTNLRGDGAKRALEAATAVLENTCKDLKFGGDCSVAGNLDSNAPFAKFLQSKANER